ncbi:MAG: aspartate/glutamate racemase family protein [Roseiflexaceae bacterium]
MTRRITFLHTAPVHVATFSQLASELAPSIPIVHLVAADLLAEARQHGLTPSLAERIDAIVAEQTHQGNMVVCTCSTIGGLAEQAGALRIDRRMAEVAAQASGRVLVAAALESTLEPTMRLLEDASMRMGRSIQPIMLHCQGAWAYFEQGDQQGYLDQIEQSLRQAFQPGDTIVLAQASMAAVAARCADLPIMILSSPRLGVIAALEQANSGAPPA